MWLVSLYRLMIGLTNYTNKAHLCRATLEAVCFQSREVCLVGVLADGRFNPTPLSLLPMHVDTCSRGLAVNKYTHSLTHA